MTGTDTLLSLVALWIVAVLTPGPNVLFFTSVALSSSARALAAAGLGVVLGTVLWGVAGLIGLLWLFELFPALAFAVKLLGGLYLAWIGFKILRGSLARTASPEATPRTAPFSPWRAFSLGLATNLSNPKSLVFVTSLFAVTHLAEAPPAIGLAGVAIMGAISGAYYLAYGFLLRLTPLRQGYGKAKQVLGVVIGAAMMAFGGRIALER